MALYFTGDTHGRMSRFFDHAFMRQLNDNSKLSPKTDIVAIAGDFGCVFFNEDAGLPYDDAESQLDKIETLPVTFVFVDGNHENFARLKRCRNIVKFGGQTGQIRKNVFWLKERGHIYDLLGYKVLCFGGASSMDRKFRTENDTWWAGEFPSDKEYIKCIEEVRKENMKVDFMLTHNAPAEALDHMGMAYKTYWKYEPATKYISDPLPYFFQFIAERVMFRRWFFGHWHEDNMFNVLTPFGYRGYTALYTGCAKAADEDYGEPEMKTRWTGIYC